MILFIGAPLGIVGFPIDILYRGSFRYCIHALLVSLQNFYSVKISNICDCLCSVPKHITYIPRYTNSKILEQSMHAYNYYAPPPPPLTSPLKKVAYQFTPVGWYVNWSVCQVLSAKYL